MPPEQEFSQDLIVDKLQRRKPSTHVGIWVLSALLAGAFIWMFLDSLRALSRRWTTESDYTYCMLVPIFSAYLLWSRRAMLEGVSWVGSWWGIAILGLAGIVQFGSSFFFFFLLFPLTLIPCLIGAFLFLGGRKVLRWSLPGILFLVFLVPMPGFLSGVFSNPLQRIGTLAGTYIIQTIGIPAASQGNVIVLPSTHLGVAEACNGLRMMMLFLAVSTGFAFIAPCRPIEKLIIIASSIPIAIIANVVRIVLTAVLYEFIGHGWGERLFHDLAGWFMMPIAVLLLYIEFELLRRLWILPPDSKRLRSGPLSIPNG